MDMKCVLRSFVGLVVAASTALAELPGARLAVSTQGLEGVLAYWGPHELPKLATVVIPGHPAQKGDKFDYADIHFQDVVMGASRVITTEDNGGKIQVVLSQVGITIPSFQFGVHQTIAGIHFHCHGFADAQIYGTRITLDATVANVNGKPDVKVTGTTKVGTIKINHRFSASDCRVADSVVEFFIGDIDTKIARAVSDELTPALSNLLGPFIETSLLKLAYTQEIIPGVTVDYSLVGPIAISAKGLSIGVKGEFRATINPQPAAFTPVSLSAPDFSRLAEVNLAESVVNEASAMLAVKLGHAGVKFANTSSLPSSLGPIRDILFRMCPGCPLYAHFAIEEPPIVHISEASGVLVNLHRAFANISLVRPTGEFINVGFTELNATASASVGLSSHGDTVKAQYSIERFNLFNISPFGGFTPLYVVQLLNYVLKTAIVSYANKNWADLPIPSVPNTSFRNVIAVEQDGFVVIKADAAFYD